jgi:hypothetical protein
MYISVLIYTYLLTILTVCMDNLQKNKGTVLIKDTTKERLKKSGFKGQTYDQIINELLDSKFEHEQLLR